MHVGKSPAAIPVVKRLAGVALEVNLRECTLHLPPQKVNKAEPTLALKPRGDITRNPKQGCQWPQNMCIYLPKSIKKDGNDSRVKSE